MTVTIDGVNVRKMIDLETKDKAVAKRKLARILEREDFEGEADTKTTGKAPLTVSEAVDETHARWVADETAVAATRRRRLERYALPDIGHMAVTDVKGSHISQVLASAREAGLSKQSVRHVRNALNSVFKGLWLDELIAENPVKRSRMPRIRETRKRRTMLTDHEIDRLLASHDVDPEIKMLVLMSRTIGGMRAGDLNVLRWSAFGEGFATSRVPRKKTSTPQVLEVPAAARPLVAAWWRLCGSPDEGPVFPVRRGKRGRGAQEGDEQQLRQAAEARDRAGLRYRGASPVESAARPLGGARGARHHAP